MGLLDHLWDDTVAGPRPNLGKLRKHSTFSFRPGSVKETDGSSGGSMEDDSPDDAVRVTRSIMIVKPPGYQSAPVSPAASPAGSTPPVSPFSGNVGGEERHFDFEEDQRRKRMKRRQARLDEQGALVLLTTCDR